MSDTGITIKINLSAEIESLLPRVLNFFEKLDDGLHVGQNRTDDEILNADDVCRIWKIPKTKLYSMTMQTGTDAIPRFKIDRDLKFKRSELIDWFDTQRVML